MIHYPCIIPTIPGDYERAKIHFNMLFDLLSVSEIIFIGPQSLKSSIDFDMTTDLYGDNKVSFIDESKLIPFDEVKIIYDTFCKEASVSKPSSVNWYYQQFLKMAYALVCPTEYYLCWDSDTLPLKPIKMFDQNSKPYFDVKTEKITTYYLTIEKLLGYSKIIEQSFISEHMIFNKSIMNELINIIEHTAFSGQRFYEKIMYAVGCDNLSLGFSEFETYGAFVGNRYPSAYSIRRWKSFRNLSFFVDIADITDDDIKWLAIDYDAATLEKYQETEKSLTALFRNERYRQKLSPEQFYKAVLESGAMGDYSNEQIRIGNRYYPI